MFGYCYLCSSEFSGINYFCVDCQRIRRYIQLYKKRPIEILDNVLLRSEDKQKNKELLELQKEVKQSEKKLEKNLIQSSDYQENDNNKLLLTELKKKVNNLKK